MTKAEKEDLLKARIAELWELHKEARDLDAQNITALHHFLLKYLEEYERPGFNLFAFVAEEHPRITAVQEKQRQLQARMAEVVTTTMTTLMMENPL